MEFDWHGMLDFHVPTYNQPDVIKREDTPSPMPEQEQTLLSFYETSYDAAIVSPTFTTDGNELPVYSSLETYQAIPAAVIPQESNSSDCYQEFFTIPDYSMYQNESVSHEPSYDTQNYSVQAEAYVVPQQQLVPQEPQQCVQQPPPAVTFPIKLDILGYVSEDITKTTTSARKYLPRKKRSVQKFTSKWNCEPCSRSFKSQGGLVQHNQQIHSGPTPHVCNICGKRFREFDNMQQHRQRHLMKDKPFKCDECPKQFIRQSDLVRHVNLHHRVSRHICSLCGKAFDRNDHLRDHELCHEKGTVKRPRSTQGLNKTIH